MTAKKPSPKKKVPAKKMGRPTVWNQITIQKIEEVAALNGTIEQMALYAGISAETIRARMRDDEDFSARITLLREKPMLKALSTIVNALGNPADAKWYAERMDKKNFSLRTELTGAEGKDLPTPIMPLPSHVPPDNSNS